MYVCVICGCTPSRDREREREREFWSVGGHVCHLSLALWEMSPQQKALKNKKKENLRLTFRVPGHDDRSSQLFPGTSDLSAVMLRHGNYHKKNGEKGSLGTDYSKSIALHRTALIGPLLLSPRSKSLYLCVATHNCLRVLYVIFRCQPPICLFTGCTPEGQGSSFGLARLVQRVRFRFLCFCFFRIEVFRQCQLGSYTP